MTILAPVIAVSPLRQRLIDEMEVRRFGRDTQRNYIRDVGRFATWLGRSPDTAMAEELRRFQVEPPPASLILRPRSIATSSSRKRQSAGQRFLP